MLFDYRASRPLAEWILALKSGRRRDLAAPLGQALAGLLTGEAAPRDVLVAVPLAAAHQAGAMVAFSALLWLVFETGDGRLS